MCCSSLLWQICVSAYSAGKKKLPYAACSGDSGPWVKVMAAGGRRHQLHFMPIFLGLDAKTMRRGLTEMELPNDPAQCRVRKKRRWTQAADSQRGHAGREILHALAIFTAGDPMRHDVLWANLSRREISRCLAAMGTPCSWGRKTWLGPTQGVQAKKSRWVRIPIATYRVKKKGS